MDDENAWLKQLAIGVGMLLVVGGLIGATVAFAGIKVADLAGITGTSTTTGSQERLRIPRNASTPTTPAPTSAPTTSISPPTSSPPPSSSKPKRAITLTVSPRTAPSFARITLTGTYRAPDGTSLRVQRLEGGGWVDFPVTTTVSGGRFSTYIQTGHTGLNRIRMTDVVDGRSSEVASFTIT